MCTSLGQERGNLRNWPGLTTAVTWWRVGRKLIWKAFPSENSASRTPMHTGPWRKLFSHDCFACIRQDPLLWIRPFAGQEQRLLSSTYACIARFFWVRKKRHQLYGDLKQKHPIRLRNLNIWFLVDGIIWQCYGPLGDGVLLEEVSHRAGAGWWGAGFQKL